MARLAKLRGDQSKEQKVEKRAKVKHIIEKVRPAVVSLSFRITAGPLLAGNMLKCCLESESCFRQVPSTGRPRLGFVPA